MNRSPSSQHKRRISRGKARQGFTYVLVLGTTLIVMTMGWGALMVTRAKTRTAVMQSDAAQARLLAMSAIHLARLKIKNDTNWRTNYASAQFTAESTAATGQFYSWKILDNATGGAVTSNPLDAVRVIGKGRVGSAVQMHSVVLTAVKVPLDVLRTTLHSSDYFNCNLPITSSGGPVSTNDTLDRDATITGAAEAVATTSSGLITGGLTCPAPVKPMPSQSVFDTYKNMATAITWGGGSSNGGTWTVDWSLLSAGVNPSGGSKNAKGIYYIAVPSTRILELSIDRICGTLVIECGSGASVRMTDKVCWDPWSPELPILLIKHTTNSHTEDWIEAAPGFINEWSVGGNLNPAHTPYNGVWNSSTSLLDFYPSRLSGLIHIMSPVPNPNSSRVIIGNGVSINGTLIADQEIEIDDNGTANLTYNSTVFTNPSLGYYTVDMVPTSGTWKMETLP